MLLHAQELAVALTRLASKLRKLFRAEDHQGHQRHDHDVDRRERTIEGHAQQRMTGPGPRRARLLDWRLMLAVVGSAIVVFAATNIDDLVVITVLLGSKHVDRRQLLVGQYLGISTLVAISGIAAIGLVVVPDRWVGLFGIIPLALGVRGLLHHGTHGPVLVKTTLGVAGITIANGADNVSVYTPIFRQEGWGDTLVYLAVFAVLVAVWVAIGAFLASRPSIARILDRWGHRIVPIVFIAIGTILILGTIRD
ncbi:MAG TPA: cadmium resistance transporter [Acidimicrobiia bacterium]|nr:cadmium resistance transporter [Acidimicrobiia bacterium]